MDSLDFFAISSILEGGDISGAGGSKPAKLSKLLVFIVLVFTVAFLVVMLKDQTVVYRVHNFPSLTTKTEIDQVKLDEQMDSLLKSLDAIRNVAPISVFPSR